MSGATQPHIISVMEQHIQSTLTFGWPGPYASECATFHTDLWVYCAARVDEAPVKKQPASRLIDFRLTDNP